MISKSIDIGLEEWLSPFPEHASEILQRRAKFFPATAERASGVARILPSWAIDDVLGHAREEVVAWFRTREGEHETAKVRPSAARELYASGITLYIQKIPQLQAIAVDIARVLGFPATHVDCALFCNRPNAATQGHFDPVDTLTVQITGNKSWRIAPNVHAPLPTIHWVHPQVPTHELRLYAHDLPAMMPDHQAETHLLEPGAMLYVPRGYWHETRSTEESVSLHIHLLPCAWADVVAKTLRSYLLRDRAWRATAYGLWGRQRAGEWDSQMALQSLREAVERLAPDDIQRPEAWVPGLEDRVVARARGAVGVVASDGEHQSVRLSSEDFGLERTTTVDMSPSYVAATLLLARSREPLSALDLAARVSSLSVEEALNLVRLLCNVGFARSHATPGL